MEDPESSLVREGSHLTYNVGNVYNVFVYHTIHPASWN